MCRRVAGVVALLLWLCSPAAARVALWDDQLELSGALRQHVLARTHLSGGESALHDSRIGLCQSSAVLEALFRPRLAQGRRCNVYLSLRYWYDSIRRIDDQQVRSIAHRAWRPYGRPQADDWISEGYVDWSNGDWQLLVGKQVVVWGETDIVRTADVVNPLDLRFSIPGIDAWEEIKRGLWMLRAFYQTGLPGDLLVEAIFIPGDFRANRLPAEGTHWGPSPADTPAPLRAGFGYAYWLLQKMDRDERGWDLRRNYEWGVRLRGLTADVDWTLFYFDTRSDVAVADPAVAGRFALRYGCAIIASRLGRNGQRWMPDYRVYRYPRYRVLGGSFQACLRWLDSSIWRLEWFYERNRRYNRARDGSAAAVAVDIVGRDAFGLGISVSDTCTIPVVTHRWCSDKQLQLILTLYHEQILDYDRDLVVDPSRWHAQGDSRATMLVATLMQPLAYQLWTIVVSATWNPNGQYFVFPMVMYAPGNHWRAECGVAVFGDRSDRARHPYGDRDSLIVRLRYEW